MTHLPLSYDHLRDEWWIVLSGSEVRWTYLPLSDGCLVHGVWCGGSGGRVAVSATGSQTHRSRYVTYHLRAHAFGKGGPYFM